MTIVAPAYILTPSKILRHKAVAFDTKIQKIAPLEELLKLYPQATIIKAPDQLLLPTFANPHLHLEFSANKATLSYGDFIPWLYSVIEHRENLLPMCDRSCLDQALDTILTSGTGAIGAISSYGEDLQACANSPLKVHFFPEIIGSNPAAADVMYASFLERFHQAKKHENHRFKTGVAIHSPYSVHYVLAKKALQIAKKYDSLVTVHFMESKAEREWLDSARGPFAKFFKDLLGQSRPVNDPKEFLELFMEHRTLFVHMIWADEKEWEMVKSMDATIVHCPISNRLLGNGVLDLQKVDPLPYTLATDGLSSNYSLNLYEELKAALFLHPNKNAVTFAKELIERSSTEGYKALGFEGGIIKEQAPADFQLVSLPQDLQNQEEIYLHLILHTSKPQAVYIEGKRHGT
ncbi:MAG: chlorohydrolase [Epsilonproteobacteria bacterium]|nr:chlorohydrolase [Campylobacterota bacterium]NPA64116.1 metal-dependent hydrolase [Campylobacterota bacterium]